MLVHLLVGVCLLFVCLFVCFWGYDLFQAGVRFFKKYVYRFEHFVQQNQCPFFLGIAHILTNSSFGIRSLSAQCMLSLASVAIADRYEKQRLVEVLG